MIIQLLLANVFTKCKTFRKTKEKNPQIFTGKIYYITFMHLTNFILLIAKKFDN